MTTVCWDGRELAADRAAWSGSFCYSVRKVYRVRAPDRQRFLVGFAGDGGYAMALLKHMHGGQVPGPYPPDPHVSSIALVIDEQLRAWKLDSNLRYVRVYGKQHALGGGQDMAIGAMAAGASAREAIRIVARHSDMSAQGVCVVRF